MSEHKPEPRDRTPIFLALIAAVATISAALIGILPNLLNSRNSPAPIVITATPAPTNVTLATNTVPVVPTDTPATPTLASASPTVTAESPPAEPSPTLDPTVRLLLVNDLGSSMEFFVDGESLTTIGSGTYQPLSVPRGRHVFRQCVAGTDYTQAGNCFEKAYDLAESPDTWQMFDSSNRLTATGDVILLALNRASIPQDLYLDGQLSERVDAGGYAALTLARGTHSIQPCAPESAPPSATCGARIEITASQPVETFLIHGE